VSRENVEVVQAVFDAAARGDTTAVMALYDPDVEWDISRTERGAMAGRVAHGREALLAWLREWYGAWETVHDDLKELIEAADGRVVSIMVQRARGRASGAEVEDRLGTVWTIRKGKVVQVVWFRSGEEALEAVGLSE
jgi:ketosteroid isomerase-like protein